MSKTLWLEQRDWLQGQLETYSDALRRIARQCRGEGAGVVAQEALDRALERVQPQGMDTPAPREIRELAEEIASEIGYGIVRGEVRDRWEARLRSSLPALASLLGELGVVRGALERIAACDCVRFEANEDFRCCELGPRIDQCPSCIARSALASDAGRLAGEMLEAVIANAAQQPEGYWIVRLPGELIAPLGALLAAYPGLREEVEDGG